MKNKRWKREAKRLKGLCNDFDYDCFFCPLHYLKTVSDCRNACGFGIREIEKMCKVSELY